LPEEPTGLMVYLEKIASNHTDFDNFSDGANGIKFFNANGNYDFTFSENDVLGTICEPSNEIYNFIRGRSNPYTGYSQTSKVFYDKNDDNKIEINEDANGGPDEQLLIQGVNGDIEYCNLGTNSGFKVGDKIGMGNQPCNHEFPKL
jgi:hypothetical protein